MDRLRVLLGGVGAGVALVVASVGGVFAADYSSQISSAGASLVTDVTPAIAAALVIGLAVMALFIAAHLALRAFHLIRGG